MNTVKHLAHDETGNDAAEYALIIAFIAGVIVTAIKGLGTQLSNAFNDAANSLK